MDDRRRDVLSVEQALSRILAAVHVLDTERVPLLDAVGRVLSALVTADRDIPPAANSAMDGFAVQGADVTKANPVRLRLVGEVSAGHPSGLAIGSGQAARIMTGAPIPSGADTVVRFEDTRTDGGWIEILTAPRVGANVRAAGEDVRAGQAVLYPGKVLRPQEIGMLAALGCANVLVVRTPRVAVLPTGDEVVALDQVPGPGQIRDANSYTIAAQVQRYGGVPFVLDVARDEEALIRQGVREAIDRGADLVITSGGVSIGDFDLVKQVLASEGEMHFWSLNMKPGRPMAFGVVAGVPLLGLPGNPVAAMISTELFARPALLKMQGHNDWAMRKVQARITQSIRRKDRRRHYLRVQLHETAAGYDARLTGDQGSGILNSLVQADGLAVIREEHDHLPAGALVEVILLE